MAKRLGRDGKLLAKRLERDGKLLAKRLGRDGMNSSGKKDVLHSLLTLDILINP